MRYYMKRFSKLRLNGSIQYISKGDFIHIPVPRDSQGNQRISESEMLDSLGEFPKQCVREYEFDWS